MIEVRIPSKELDEEVNNIDEKSSKEKEILKKKHPDVLEMMKINEIKNTLDCITNRLH
jgi:hypothetical protein